jgi:hypothetical protein
MDVFNADYAERFSSLLQQNCGLRPPNVSSTMVGLPLKRHDLGSSFLQMLPYFRDRRLPTGQAFTGSLRSTQSADQTRKLSVTLPDLRSKLSTYQSSDGFTGMPKSYKSSLEILDAFGAQADITFTTARPQNRRSLSSVRLPKLFHGLPMYNFASDSRAVGSISSSHADPCHADLGASTLLDRTPRV